MCSSAKQKSISSDSFKNLRARSVDLVQEFSSIIQRGHQLLANVQVSSGFLGLEHLFKDQQKQPSLQDHFLELQ